MRSSLKGISLTFQRRGVGVACRETNPDAIIFSQTPEVSQMLTHLMRRSPRTSQQYSFRFSKQQNFQLSLGGPFVSSTKRSQAVRIISRIIRRRITACTNNNCSRRRRAPPGGLRLRSFDADAVLTHVGIDEMCSNGCRSQLSSNFHTLDNDSNRRSGPTGRRRCRKRRQCRAQLGNTFSMGLKVSRSVPARGLRESMTPSRSRPYCGEHFQ